MAEEKRIALPQGSYQLTRQYGINFRLNLSLATQGGRAALAKEHFEALSKDLGGVLEGGKPALVWYGGDSSMTTAGGQETHQQVFYLVPLTDEDMEAVLILLNMRRAMGAFDTGKEG